MKVLAHNGVHVRVEHPECCGMPKFENGDLSAVASAAERVADYFAPLIAAGYDIVPLTTRCSLMLTFGWPLLNSANDAIRMSTAESRVGQECVNTCRVGWAHYLVKRNKKK